MLVVEEEAVISVSVVVEEARVAGEDSGVSVEEGVVMPGVVVGGVLAVLVVEGGELAVSVVEG